MGDRLGERIAARARRFGPLPWSQFMEAALYDPDEGFYQVGGRAGRGGDFVTSPELGPLFATTVARALDRCWEELGRPDPFFVVEAAAGAGTLARDILAAVPACSPALRYVLVERSAALRAAQAERLPLEQPSFVLGPSNPTVDGDEEEDRPMPGRGPLVTSLAELPALPLTGVVLANELLDNLPLDLLEWRQGRWHEVRVAAAEGSRDELVEVVFPAPPDVAAEASRLVGGAGRTALRATLPGGVTPVAEGGLADGATKSIEAGLPDGARIPLQRGAVEWLGQALDLVERGRVILIDYADTTDALAQRPWPEWLRTFRQHQAALFPLDSPGTQDITCVVAWDQLSPPDDNRSQAEWLAEHGLQDLTDAARHRWRERAAIGDLVALAARSRVHEAQALTDPSGLGGHRILQWVTRSPR
jgi:SAM-dependent MidA family methyltransferase